MGSLFGGNKVKTPTITPVPTVDDAQIQADAEAERERRQKAAGNSSNIVSSLAGSVSDAADPTARSSLLGG